MRQRLFSGALVLVLAMVLGRWAPPWDQIKFNCHPHHHHYCQGL